MAIVYTDSANYSDIADAIRSKNGTQNTYKPEDMADAIDAIPTGVTPTGTMSITSDGTYDVTDYATAIVSIPGPPVGYYYKIRSTQVTIGANSITNVAELVEFLKNAVANLNYGEVIGYSAGEPHSNNNFVVSSDVTQSMVPMINNVFMYRNGTITSVPAGSGYDAAVESGTTYVVYIADKEGI